MTSQYTQKFIAAACVGDLEEVQRWIPLAHVSAERNAALQVAGQNGHIECLRLLLSVCDTRQYMLVFLLSRLTFDPFKGLHADFVQSPEQQQYST